MKLIVSKLAILAIILTFSQITFSQLNVNNGFTAQQLGNNLAGNNVNVFNATISGDPQQYGMFNYTGTDLGLNSGEMKLIILDAAGRIVYDEKITYWVMDRKHSIFVR